MAQRRATDTGEVMNRVVVTRAILGLCHMQVCAVKDATDEEVLDVCNRENPAGTRAGWAKVERETRGEVECNDHAERIHLIVSC